MAYSIDTEFKIPLSRKLYFRSRGREVILATRAAQRKMKGVGEQASEPDFGSKGDFSIFNVDWDAVGEFYQTHKWAFIDPLFTDDFYQKLKTDWPEKCFLDPPRKPTKWYDSGFFWQRNTKTPRYMDAHPAVSTLFASLGCDAFESALSKVLGCEMKFFESHITDSGPGAEVPMHMDSLAKDDASENAVGIAIFVSGAEGGHSGGLSVSGSKSWEDVFFEPENLNNTALLYSKQLHHGFRPIDPGKHRWSLNTQYWPKGTRD